MTIISSSKVTVTWRPGSDLDLTHTYKVRVEGETVTEFNQSATQDGGIQKRELTGLSAASTYVITVTSYNSVGQSTGCTTHKVTTGTSNCLVLTVFTIVCVCISTYINTKIFVCLSVCLFVTVFLGHFETDWETLWHEVSI